ncbi:hypothetical protein THAOC_08258 [Thalassiosira oceanica]|uniref:MYND-type domain-containing protein n=1 Tax=Thalassiosira oceanica TaxID=159749 RepID=K0SVF2_THAOC|nr:hypothetical protein THAOC_08258 [Thalassiosira oceanica]|eukprot:EJK70388.1 hypothetical protein THAOC_08258 [Thalassiosira oceanica]
MRSSIRHCLYQGPLPLDDAICKAVADEIVRTKQCPGISTDVAMHAVRQRHPGVLDDPERRSLVQARLVSRAVHYLDALIDTKREPKAAIEFARDLAGPIYMLDQFEMANETLKDSSYLAFMDGVNGCDRRLLKFYAKRFCTCSCMQALYNNAREEHTKTGLCSLCGNRVALSELMGCTGCWQFQTCSEECTVRLWNQGHRKNCGPTAFKDLVLTRSKGTLNAPDDKRR